MDTLFHLLIIIAIIILLILTLSVLHLCNTIQKLSATDFFYNEIVVSTKQLYVDAIAGHGHPHYLDIPPQILRCISDCACHLVRIKNIPWLFNTFQKIIFINIINRICSNPTAHNISRDSFTKLLKYLYQGSIQIINICTLLCCHITLCDKVDI